MPPKDRFHDYLDYCEQNEPVSIGDYIERVVRANEVLAWTRLTRDIIDTYKAGRLKKIKLDNGGAAYVRKPEGTHESAYGSTSESKPHSTR